MHVVKRFIADDRGATLIEYGIVAALIAWGLVSAVASIAVPPGDVSGAEKGAVLYGRLRRLP